MSFKNDNELNPLNPFLGDKLFSDLKMKLALSCYPNRKNIFTVFGSDVFSTPTSALQNTNVGSVGVSRG